jgi:hypothetical protein
MEQVKKKFGAAKAWFKGLRQIKKFGILVGAIVLLALIF